MTIILLEFRNLIKIDFTKELYYPLGMSPQVRENFIQWMTGADRSGLETGFRYKVDGDEENN